MKSNRLKLDFSIPDSKGRQIFLEEYLKSPQFSKKPLTSEELEMCGNYILWGRDIDGKNSVQKKIVQIDTRNKTWNQQEAESLEALLESPTFNENNIVSEKEPPRKVIKEVFSREQALKECPEELKETFINLFKLIDTLDLITNYYDLLHGKRKNPPREELLKNFTEEEQEELKERATHLNQFSYLKMRHQLVELRKEQFSIRDSYKIAIRKDPMYNFVQLPVTQVLDADIGIYPLGFKYEGNSLSETIFRGRDDIIPENFSEKQLDSISKFYWKKTKDFQEKGKENFFDFRNQEHLYNLVLLLGELEESFRREEENKDISNVENTTKNFLDTFWYYVEFSQLEDIYMDILNLKIKKEKNQDIADFINQKYGKSYTSNYISTIFKQKIIKKISDGALFHFELMGLIYFKEEFKTCNTCGKTLLKTSENFVKKERSKDGFTNRCKKCDKVERQKKKLKMEGKI